MRVLIINGSARGIEGVTARMAISMTNGLSESGAEVKHIFVNGMDISPCRACMSCMHDSPGICTVKDDMTGIYDDFQHSDVFVMATPVYADSMPAQLKMIIDRSTCCMNPYLTKDEWGRVRHFYTWRMPAKFLLLSTSGFPETETFAPLVATFRAQANSFGSEAIGEICIPGAIAFQMEPSVMEGHLALLKEAGRMLGKTGSISGELLNVLNTPPLNTDQYLAIAKKYEEWISKQLNKCRANARGFAG
ncbi:MAG: flavodoxin family protein [Spirochaetota bacterium]